MGDLLFDSFFGLPLHPLIVHATVVFVPTAVVAVLLAAFWGRFRRWAGPGPMIIALIALILVPISTQSGEALEHSLPRTDLIHQHGELADGLLPWVAGLFVVAAGLWWWNRDQQSPGTAPRWALPRWLVVVLIVGAVVTGVGTTVQVVLIGHSGAEAAWSGVVTT